jgi:hypothetical protein
VAAEFKNGVLTLRLPKVESERHRVVKITLAEPNRPIGLNEGEVPQ